MCGFFYYLISGFRSIYAEKFHGKIPKTGTIQYFPRGFCAICAIESQNQSKNVDWAFSCKNSAYILGMDRDPRNAGKNYAPRFFSFS